MQQTFDSLYVISDLHIGGLPGAQAFAEGLLLADLIRHLRQNEPARNLCLVLAGDIIDFLVEPGPGYLKSDAIALQRITHIADNAVEFSGIFTELARFVQTPCRSLILLGGNHDLELALPSVRDFLIEKLTKPTSPQNANSSPQSALEEDALRIRARSQLSFIFDGSGFRCRVGGASVLVVHGNEADSYNVVDHGALSRVCALTNRGQPVPAWTPNAGTKLVVGVMAEVRKEFPFIDLLKPEDEVVIPILLALRPAKILKFFEAAQIAPNKVIGAARQAGWLGDEEGEAAPGTVGPALIQATGHELLNQVERDFRQGLSPLEVLDGNANETLGMLSSLGNYVGYLSRRLIGKSPVTALREGLKAWLQLDATYSLDYPDDTFHWLDANTSADIDFLISGHTHLARALRRQNGGAYFNSGTWMRLLQIRAEHLVRDETFAPIYDVLKAGTMAALDKFPDLFGPRPTVVEIAAEKDSGMVRGRLCRCEHDLQSVLVLKPQQPEFTWRQQ